jgi:hypothetical protein
VKNNNNGGKNAIVARKWRAQTFSEKIANLSKKQNGALLNNIFYLRKLLIKIWKFKDKSSQNLELISPKWGNFTQSGHTARKFAQSGHPDGGQQGELTCSSLQMFWWRSTFMAAISSRTRGRSSPSCLLSIILMATFSPVKRCVASLTLAKPPVPTVS